MHAYWRERHINDLKLYLSKTPYEGLDHVMVYYFVIFLVWIKEGQSGRENEVEFAACDRNCCMGDKNADGSLISHNYNYLKIK